MKKKMKWFWIFLLTIWFVSSFFKANINTGIFIVGMMCIDYFTRDKK